MFLGLTIFGDCAYITTQYMTTPFKSPSKYQDDFNFYHSQLRIKIECAFGKLVWRWGILRKGMSRGISIKKTNAMVLSLCKLHNFCTNRKIVVEPPCARDEFHISWNGGIDLNFFSQNKVIPTPLIGGGSHFDDLAPSNQRQFKRKEGNTEIVPRDALFQHIVQHQLERPTPKNWNK